MQINNQASEQGEISTPPVIDIELLALDLNRCARCVGTLDHIERAIEIIRPVLEVMEVQVKVRKIVVESEEQARQHQFATSPTVRINHKDIAFETLESECPSCTDLCGCDEGTSCRVWRYRGEEYTEAPVGLVVASILREIFDSGHEFIVETPVYSGVPDNLRRFFRSRPDARTAVESCCSAAEQKICCEPNRKAVCCDASQPETCGCH